MAVINAISAIDTIFAIVTRHHGRRPHLPAFATGITAPIHACIHAALGTIFTDQLLTDLLCHRPTSARPHRFRTLLASLTSRCSPLTHRSNPCCCARNCGEAIVVRRWLCRASRLVMRRWMPCCLEAAGRGLRSPSCWYGRLASENYRCSHRCWPACPGRTPGSRS